MKIAKTINIANGKVFVSELKKLKIYLTNIPEVFEKTFNDSFYEVGNPEVALRGITAPIQNKVTGEYDDGFYPAPENMVFEVIESHSADGSESERLAFVSFEPTKEEKPDFFYIANNFFDEEHNSGLDGIDIAAKLAEKCYEIGRNEIITSLQSEVDRLQLENANNLQRLDAAKKLIKQQHEENTKLREALDINIKKLIETILTITDDPRRDYTSDEVVEKRLSEAILKSTLHPTKQ